MKATSEQIDAAVMIARTNWQSNRRPAKTHGYQIHVVTCDFFQVFYSLFGEHLKMRFCPACKAYCDYMSLAEKHSALVDERQL